MRKRMFVKACVLAAMGASGVFAIPPIVNPFQPNYEKTTIFGVGFYETDAPGNYVTTEYSDGLDRNTQAKLILNDSKDRVSCSYYDESGRPSILTKTFVDNLNFGKYLPGEIADATIKNQLEASNLSDSRAFSETQYWDDPRGQVKTSFGPGAAYTTNTLRSWVFGVGKENLTINLGIADNPQFSGGFIISGATESMLDDLTQYMLENTTFTSPQYFLTITKDEKDVYTQDLKDLFGNTLATRHSVTPLGDQIIPEYEYNIMGNIVKEKPPVATTNPVDNTEYKYNTLGQTIWKKTPDGGEYTFDYYPDGKPYRMILWTGGTEDIGVAHLYDEFGRETRIEDLVMGYASFPVVQYYYDDVKNVPMSYFSPVNEFYFEQMTNLKGRLAAAITTNRGEEKNINVGELYSYDSKGRIIRKILVIQGSPLFKRTDYVYDIFGKLISEDFYYSGDHVRKNYSYDELGRLKRIYHAIYDPVTKTYSNKELVKNTYDDLGKLQSKNFSAITPGTYNVSNTFDIRNRLTNINSTGAKGFSEIIGYPAINNISSATFTYTFGSGAPTAYTCSYAYDDVNRLTGATINDGTVTANNAYSYDVVGRFTAKKEEGLSNLAGYEYYSNNDRLKKNSKNSATGNEYIYDKKGNLVVDFTKNMVIQYDWRNMPLTFWFYNALSSAGIPKDASTGIYNGASNLYWYMSSKVSDGTVNLVSKLLMVYDSNGKRVCKMGAQE